jgi:transposase
MAMRLKERIAMHSRETRVLLRHYLEQGVSKTELAKRFGISRRTVYHWIETGQLDRDLDSQEARYRARPPVPTQLDPYKPIIQARLEAFPLLTAQRLFEELRSVGYRGGYTQLKEYVRRVRPHAPVDPVVRFETPPGYQGQVDFGTFQLPWGRRYALLVVLGYSRLLWMRFYPRQTLTTLIRGLESAFEFFGGVPQELLFDQMRAVVLSDERLGGSGLIMNAEFVRFSAHWGFRARACRPYRARTKGKVERPIRYLRQSFFYGRTFLNDEDLNTQSEHWLHQICNVRRHGTLREVPQVRFERDERARLGTLAVRPYPQITLASPVVPIRAAQRVEVQRRPLSVYAEAVR